MITSKSAITKVQAAVIAIILIIAAITVVYYVTLPSPSEKTGGTLVITVGVEPTPNLDPAFYMTGIAADTVHYTVFETLVIYDYDMSIKPYLAESFTQIDDLTWEFKLREGVKFHDGTSCNATAVKLHFDRLITLSSPRQISVAMIDSVEVVDEYTVKMHLKYAYIDFLHEMASETGVASPTAVEKWGEDFGVHPVGTGPFKFVEWIHGDHITLEAFEDHWSGRPHLDKVIIKLFPEASVRLMQLETGEGYLTDIECEQTGIAEAMSNVELHVGAPVTRRMIVLNQYPQGPEALKDVRVRQAINYAINRKEIMDTLYQGYGVVGIGPLYPGVYQYNPDLKGYPDEGNLTKARQLLEEAGYSDGLKLKILGRAGTIEEDECVIIKDQLAKVGIEVEIEILEFSVFAEKLVVTREFDISAADWSGSGPTALGVMYEFYLSTETDPWHWNLCGVNDTELDDLLSQLRVESDPDTFQDLCDQIQQIIIENAYDVTVLYPDKIHATNKAVQDYKVHPHTWYGFLLYAEPLGTNVWLEQS